MFKLNLVTPEKSIVTGSEIDEVSVPAHRGVLDILPGHAPLMTTLEPGVLSYRLKGEEAKKVIISWGYCQVSPEGVNVLAELATEPSEINIEKANAAIKSLEARLLGETLDDENWARVQHDLARARAEVGFTKH